MKPFSLPPPSQRVLGNLTIQTVSRLRRRAFKGKLGKTVPPVATPTRNLQDATRTEPSSNDPPGITASRG